LPQRPLPGTNGNLPRSMHCNGQVAKKARKPLHLRHHGLLRVPQPQDLCPQGEALLAVHTRRRCYTLSILASHACSSWSWAATAASQRLLVAAPFFFFFFLTGFCMFCTPTDFPIQVSPQWIKSADRTVVEVTNLVMQADTSGDGLLDTQEITVGAVPVGFVTWPRRRCAKAVPRVLSVLGQPCPSNSATVLLLGSLHVEAVLFSRV
jgi:hypothetical protein